MRTFTPSILLLPLVSKAIAIPVLGSTVLYNNTDSPTDNGVAMAPSSAIVDLIQGPKHRFDARSARSEDFMSDFVKGAHLATVLDDTLSKPSKEAPEDTVHVSPRQ